jgi:hypothetical protein
VIHASTRRGALTSLTGPLLGALVASIALVALLGPAVAIGSSAQIQVTPVQPAPGERVTVRGSGFCPRPCTAVTLTVDGSTAATNIAVATNGTFQLGVGLTPVAGTSTIVASQTDKGGARREATAIVQIVASDQIGATPPAAPAGTSGAPPAAPAGTSGAPTASPPPPGANLSPPPTGSPATSAAAPEIQISPAQPTPGQQVTVRGSGFCSTPCSPVTVSVDGSVAAGGIAVAAGGTFEVTVGMTPVAGTSTIVASQTDASGAVRQATATVQVVASDQTGPTPSAPPSAPPAAVGSRTPGEPGLASQAAPTWIALALAAILLLVAATVTVARLRRRG